jgi:hypothetical protein
VSIVSTVLFPEYGFATPPNQKINVETVEQYGVSGHCNSGWSNFYAAGADGTNFWNEMFRVNYYGFQAGNYWYDNNVWDADFCDRDTSGANSGCDDSVTFDQLGSGISYFEGHGIDVPHTASAQLCTSWTQCTNPPAGASSPGTCVSTPDEYPIYNSAVCHYASTRAMVTCSSSDINGHFANLDSHMAFGENPGAGGWRGAATNGGTALAIVRISNGLIPFYPFAEWSEIFGGLNLYAGVMPTSGDTATGTFNFGSSLAQFYSNNPNGSVADAYANALSNVNGGSGSCASGSPPGHGFNGCGCHVITNFDDTQQHVNSYLKDSWYALQYLYPMASPSWVAWEVSCNYNNGQYGWSGLF